MKPFKIRVSPSISIYRDACAFFSNSSLKNLHFFPFLRNNCVIGISDLKCMFIVACIYAFGFRGNFLENDFWIPPLPPPPFNFVHDHFFNLAN